MKNSLINRYANIAVSIIVVTSFFLVNLRIVPVYAQTNSLKSEAVSWWRAENNTNDANGSNNEIIHENASYYADGKIGLAYNFDGIDDAIRIPSSDSLNILGSMTIEGWVYPTWDSDDINPHNIFSKWSGEDDWQRTYSFVAIGSKLLFAISDSDHELDSDFHAFITPNDVLTLSAWNHVAAVYDQPTGTRKIYVNGLMVASRIDDPIFLTPSISGATIGARSDPNGATEEYFMGRIDELCLYHRALSDTEIATNAPQSEAVSWWRAENNTNDSNGNNHGIIIINEANPIVGYASGKIGLAFNFDGVDDAIRIPSSDSLNILGSMTIEGWVYPTWGPDDNNLHNIFSKWGGYGDWQRTYSFVAVGSKLLFAISDSDHELDSDFHAFTTPNDVLTLNAWNHVAAVYDQPTGTRKIYVNGLMVASRIDDPIFLTPSISGATIGARSDPNGASEYFMGRIDELSLYQHVLSDAEIGEVYWSSGTTTSIGSNVTIVPESWVTIHFDNVTQEGFTMVQTNLSSVSAPDGFQLVGTINDLSTNSQFNQAQVCFIYDEAALTPVEESDIQLYHFENNAWADVTDNGYPDTTNNVVCGTVNSFSPFAVMYLLNEPDTTPPTITWVGNISNGYNYYFGFVSPEPTCTADDLSGVDGACTVTGYSTTIGVHTLTAEARDMAGNVVTETRSYTVLPWTLTGFYQPVDMNGVYNIVKGGSTVPLKFEIFAGSTELTDVADIKSLTYAQTSCDVTAITDEIETTATGNTSLRYADGQFIYNWKTPKTAGICYRVTMTANDGSSLMAYFKLK